MRGLSEIWRVLPQEVYDEIAAQFEAVIPYQEPGRQVLRNISPFANYDLITAWYERKSKPDVETLRDLRFLCKRFDIAARTVLFRSTHRTWAPNYDHEWWALANLPYSGGPPKLLKHLKINLQSAFAMSVRDERSPIVGERLKNSDLADMHSFQKELCSLEELRSLDVYTGQTESRYAHGFGAGVQPNADDIDIGYLTLFTAHLSAALSTPSSFTHLTELRLSLPCTHDYIVLRKQLPTSLLQQIKKLFLSVTDATGPGGSRNYLRNATEAQDADHDYTSSVLQRLYPNREHAHWMFEIATQCPNLETLALAGTQRLDCDLLTLSTSSLSSFSLHRMTGSASKLIELLPPSTLSRLWLQDVELTSGSWDEVFDHLQKCDKLEYLNPSNCSYARGGSSFHLKALNGREWADVNNLWSYHEPDYTSLVKLVGGLVDKAGGRAKYPNLLMEQDMLPDEVENDEGTDDEHDDDEEDFEDYDEIHGSGGSDFDGEDAYDENFHY